MRKSAVAIPILAIVAGLAGFLFRRMEVGSVFDEVTGLAERGAPATLLVIAVTVLTVALAVAFAVAVSARYKAEPDYVRAFAPRGFLYLGVSFLLAAVLFAAAVWFYAVRRVPAVTDPYAQAAGASKVLDLVFTVLAALSAVSVLMLARRAYKGSEGGEMLLFGVIPPIFLCFWLVLLYKENAANPVLISYCYQVLAIAAAALAYYFSAGFVYHKAVTGRVIAAFLAAIYFCAVVIADTAVLPVKIMYGATAANLFVNAVVFLKNLKRRGAR